MLGKRSIDAACVAAILVAVLLTSAFAWAGSLGLIEADRDDAYLDLLFESGRVHHIDIQIDDWDAFLASAPAEVYTPCSVAVDGEELSDVGLRAKGNNSLSHLSARGLTRYSLKIEFDHYRDGQTYHGLDKLSLDAAFQDNSYLKTYLAFDMMRFMGVPTPATSFVQVSVNGEAWGLYLAIEEPEDAFAERVWGAGRGLLYKPDYRSLDDENADVALRYLGDDPASYPGIFERARIETSPHDEERLIEALRLLDAGDRASIEAAVDVEEVLRYFAVQTFVVNLDSYLGRTGHNYLLYEEDGRISLAPWDYNLAFGTYALGRPELPDDATTAVNLPIDTPAATEVLARRPLFSKLMAHEAYRLAYHDNLSYLAAEYVERGRLQQTLQDAAELIAPYVEADATRYITYEEFLQGVNTLEAFCLLRAESVRGQLEGNIPCTNEGQLSAPDALVDASSIRIEDLGELSDLD
ncbi:CotH kinase family protein [Enorma phocaeensis]|uniref:CotH kinase family protein n=1 Tax=Enorma phocaeensis TaxID=1871019 RepID=A0ABT7V6U6_9ACTN|nr:CotH kinase family protein [Enorma phocaeensis]MDM8274213.1 CotH kinase family protein [Enorma phocaeensis]